jgi:cytoskeletal protein CcmA (bactofilin family)
MGATYTRQSSYSDGDVITAAHTNDEFNQLLAAFASSSGHTHDGTSAEGGPITKLLGNTLTFGAGTAGTDITVTFDGETSDGVLKWMEDEDYFEFSDDILVASTEKLQFRDTAIYINSSTDGQLDIVADTEVQIAATTIDMNGNADVSGTLTYGSLSDGAITITAFVDEDNMASNSATLVPTQQSVKAYVDTQLTAEDLDFQADSGGALSIDLDSETLTFTGGTGIDTSGSGNAVTFAIDSTVATLAGTQTFTNKTLTSPKINENVALTATATELNLLDGVSGLVQADFTKLAAVDSTATELNIVDGNTSIGTTTVSDGHGIVMNHGGTMAQTTVQTLAAYLDDEITAMPNLVTTAATTVGALNSGSITSGFGTIDTGSSTITTTGLITGGSLDIDDVLINGTTIGHTDDTDLITLSNGVVTVAGEVDAVTLDVSGNIDVDGTANLDNTDIDGTLVVDGSNISLDSTSTLNIDNSNTSNGITIGTATSGVPVSIGHTTSETTVNDNLTVTGDLTVSGTTTTVNSTTVNLNDHNIVLDTGNTTSAVINGAGITIEGGSGDDATFTYNTTGPQFELKLGSSFEDLQTAKLTATELDISGDVDVDGTLEADAITVNGTALGTVIAGTTVTNATTAAVATTVTISDNENTDEDNAIIFTAGGDVDGGNIGLESDGDLTYNPSTGRLTATQLSGTLQTAAQANVTSLGTLTTLTVDNVIINGSTIGHTGDTDLMTVASGVLTVAGEVDATSLDISGDADIDGTLEADAITVNGTALNTVIANEATALSIALG